MTNASCYRTNSFQQCKTISWSQWFQIQINIWLFKPHRKERRLIRMCLKSLEPPASNQWSYTPKHFLRSAFMDVFLNFLCLAVRRKTFLKSTIVQNRKWQNTVKQMHAICGFLRLPFRWQLAVSVIWQNRANEFVFQNDTTQETKSRAGMCTHVLE